MIIEVPFYWVDKYPDRGGDLIDQVLAHYDKLDEEIRAELPLKRIWVVAEPAE